MTPWQLDTLLTNKRLIVPLPQRIQFCGDPGAIPSAIDPIPTLEIRLVHYDKSQNAVKVEFIHQDKSTFFWFSLYTLSQMKSDIVSFAMNALIEAERVKAREEKKVRERYERLVGLWLKGREWAEECSCCDEPEVVCWYHLSDDDRRKERTRTMVDLLVGAI